MSTMPWGTMNGWLRLETEQRGTWLQQRVQDLRAAQVARQPESEVLRLVPVAAERQLQPNPGCSEAGAGAEAEATAKAA